MILNSCTVGTIMEMSQESLCFEHCTLRDNCIAVNTSDGCQMCYLNDLLDDEAPFHPGSSNVYIRKDHLGKQLLIIVML